MKVRCGGRRTAWMIDVGMREQHEIKLPDVETCAFRNRQVNTLFPLIRKQAPAAIADGTKRLIIINTSLVLPGAGRFDFG